jgi:hypothetical protein
MATQSLLFSSFNPIEEISHEDLVNSIFYNRNQEDNRFILKEYSTDFIDGLYVIFYVSKELVYNIEKNELESIEVKRSIAIPLFLHHQQYQ